MTFAHYSPEASAAEDYAEEEPTPGELALTPVPLERALLGDAMARGVEAPTMVHTWLYAGALTTIQAEPGVGKSLIALWMAAAMVAAGYAVIYLDEEGGAELVAERLCALGVDPGEIDRLLWYYPFPGRRWDEVDVVALGDVVYAATDRAPLGMVVVDSMADFLAMAGLSEDSGRDVTLFCDRIMGPVRAAGGALVVLDHLTKPDPDANKRTKSRYARGSGAKLAKAALTMLLEVERDFDRTHSGALRLWKTKDRRGAVPLPVLDRPPLVLDVTVAEEGRHLRITESNEAPHLTSWNGPTKAMESCLGWLKAHPGEGFSARYLTERIVDFTTRRGFRRETVAEALRALAHDDESGVVMRDGPNRSLLFSWGESAGQVAPSGSREDFWGGSEVCDDVASGEYQEGTGDDENDF